MILFLCNLPFTGNRMAFLFWVFKEYTPTVPVSFLFEPLVAVQTCL
jgi:hypothetical protein